MEKIHTIVVVGGGYAGIHTVKALLKQTNHKFKIILIDRQPDHIRKVKLFRATVSNEELRIPFSELFGNKVDFIQASLKEVLSAEKKIVVEDAADETKTIDYDRLVLSLGSVVKQPAQQSGGFVLKDIESAKQIRDHVINNMEQAIHEGNPQIRKRLLSIAIVGGGITGIETATELIAWLKGEASSRGLNVEDASVSLINSKTRLFHDAPESVGAKIEKLLKSQGISVIHQRRVTNYSNKFVEFESGSPMEVGCCVWTPGLRANPLIEQLGLSTKEEKLIVDQSYRVAGKQHIYSIGDCARVTDPRSGQMAGMTCKEAIIEAERLAKVIVADIEGIQAPIHETIAKQYCVYLGPGNGFAWAQKWGINMMITGKLGWKVREYTWNIASLVK